MSDARAIHAGDRCLARERPWLVRACRQLTDAASVVELEALDGDAPASLSMVVPPDELIPLPGDDLRFDPSTLDAHGPWRVAHEVLGATLVRETGLLSGARFGRVVLEAYQLAPTLRLLSKPRPRLLIADDVGLGKTIEAGLALLELLARGRARRVLIVVPPGLLLQWREEMRERFGLDFVGIENAAGVARVQSELPAGTNPWDALPRVITSVDFLKKDTVRTRALRKRWDLIVVDEAHGLAEAGTPANPYRTQRTRLGAALRDNARGLLLLTATPHNGYGHSFRSLVDLVEPSAAVIHGAREHIQRRVQSAMIRRMKVQIVRRRADGAVEPMFPPRRVEGIPVAASLPERELLQKVAAYCARTARSARAGDETDLVTFAMQIVKKRALSSRAALTRTIEHRLEALRQPEAETPPEPAELRDLQADLPLDEAGAERTAERIIRSAIPKEERQRRAETRALNGIRRLLRSLPERDPKIEALLGEIRRVVAAEPDARLIVFTEYRDTLDAVRTAIGGSADLAGRSVVLHGGLSVRQRARVQETFETPDVRLLLATDAASEGLNLQRACHRVVHVELPWNPNRLEQRNGRVDRYGQTKSPEIRYLYYPDSPEDDVLHQLVRKIESMQRDRVSTPDILGVLRGAGEIERGLVELDPESADIESAKSSLVRLFEDRTADFVRNVQPLIAAGAFEAAGQSTPVDMLDTADPLLTDDGGLDVLVRSTLGANAVKPAGAAGVVRIEVPLRYRGPGVQPVYPHATFRRSVAVRSRADEVEFVTPIHPLMLALAADARHRLLQVYPDERGLPARRLAARRVGAGEPPSAVFTFLGAVQGGGGLLEESLLAVRLTNDLRVVGIGDEALGTPAADPGEVGGGTLARLFARSFEAMAARAREVAAGLLAERTAALRERRGAQAGILRADLETDLADRQREIDDDERRARGLIDDRTGQARLFADAETRGGTFAARRAAGEALAEARRAEIAEFETVADAGALRALGALFLVPADEA